MPSYSSGVSSYIVQILTSLCSSSALENLEYVGIAGICAATSRAKTLAAVFYAPLGFDLLLCSLTIYHGWKDYRSQSGASAVPLFRVMYRGAYAQVMALAGRLLKSVCRWNDIFRHHGCNTDLEYHHRVSSNKKEVLLVI
jgi:hypothetical protein